MHITLVLEIPDAPKVVAKGGPELKLTAEIGPGRYVPITDIRIVSAEGAEVAEQSPHTAVGGV